MEERQARNLGRALFPIVQEMKETGMKAGDEE